MRKVAQQKKFDFGREEGFTDSFSYGLTAKLPILVIFTFLFFIVTHKKFKNDKFFKMGPKKKGIKLINSDCFFYPNQISWKNYVIKSFFPLKM